MRIFFFNYEIGHYFARNPYYPGMINKEFNLKIFIRIQVYVSMDMYLNIYVLYVSLYLINVHKHT
jgi:hypothetical protein